MSVDIATLGIKVDSTDVRKADSDLDRLAKTGNTTEKSIGGLSKASDILKSSMGQLSIIAGVSAAVTVLSTALISGVSAAKEFSRTMGEISTLVDPATWSISELSEEIKKQAAIYGSNVSLQGAAMYEIISSGATDAADAINQLTFANKLSVAGMTTVAVAADGLTSVINAYGKDVLSAQDASDSMFTAMLYGKLKIEDLATGLGNVAPLANKLGVTFDELTGSVAALTAGGVRSSVAITGVRAILASIVKPSDEAGKLADKLGINFSSAGLKAMGFAGFMEHVKEKTHGNSDAMAILFGGVEALVPALDLTGKAGVKFAEIMKEMADKADATDEALAKINATPAQQLNVIMSTLGVTALNAGQSILNFFGPAISELANVMSGAKEPGVALDAILKALAITAGVAALRAVIALTAAIYAKGAALVLGSRLLMGYTAMVGTMGVVSATASLGVMALGAAARGLFALLGGPVGIALAAVAAGLYYLYNSSKNASMSIEDLAKKTGHTTDELGGLYEQAVKNVAAKDKLDEASRNAAGGMNAGGKAADIFKGKLVALGWAAAYANLEVAKLGLSQAKQQQNEAKAAVASAADAQENSIWKNTTFGRNVLGAKRGRADKQLDDANKNAREQIEYGRLAVENMNNLRNPPKIPTIDTPGTLDLNTDGPKKGGRKGGAKSEAEKAAEEAKKKYADAIKSGQEYVTSLQQETAEIGKNSIETKMMAAQRAADTVLKAGNTKETKELASAIMAEAEANKAATIAQANKMFKRDIGDQADQLKYENSLIGKSAIEIEKANYQRAIDLKIREAQRNGIPLDIALIKKETDAWMEQFDIKNKGSAAIEAATATSNTMREAAESVRSLTEGFGELFGTAGEGFSNLINTIFEYGEAQAALDLQMTEIAARRQADGTLNEQDQQAYNQAESERGRNKVAIYGQMLGAAKGFFKEGSTGYKILEGAERAYKLFQFAMQVKSIIMDTIATGSSVANSGVRAAADGSAAVAKAMSYIPPPFNFIVAGAVIAFLIAMGVKMAGGKGKGGSGGMGGSSTADKAKEEYIGPRDQYGAPTSSYSVLKPGGTTVANDNVTPYAGTSGGGGGFNNSVTLVINGGADMRTINEQVMPLLEQQSKQTVEDARQAVAADQAARSNRQSIGGG